MAQGKSQTISNNNYNNNSIRIRHILWISLIVRVNKNHIKATLWNYFYNTLNHELSLKDIRV